MPGVTVIIPTYNWSSVLPYSIASVLAQTFTDFELLVIGDGCTDDSEAVVRAIDDPRVRWIGIPRTGHQSGPNNEGLRQARGEIIAYLGHDDLWLPHHLAEHVRALEESDLAWSLFGVVAPDSEYVEACVPDAARGWCLTPTALTHRRSIGVAWRDYRELSTTPEQEVASRALAAGHRAALVPRLTALKFPASLRRDVYKEKPSHEQQSWLERIRTEPDLEAVLLAANVAYPERRRSLTFLRRAWRLLCEPSQWLAFLWRRNGARVRARQRFKGVEDAARSAER